MELSTADAIVRILVALILGAIVGLERELSHHPAGLRTHILVCIGSAVFTILSISSLTLGLDVIPDAQTGDLRIVRDPSRIAAQIVTGIGFIGGGAVLRHGATVRGLTTAASLWMIASVGMLAGSGHFTLAIVSTLLALMVLFLLGKLGQRLAIKRRLPYNRLRMLVSTLPVHTSEVQAWVERNFPDRVLEAKTNTSKDGLSTLTYILDVEGGKIDVNETSRHLNTLTGVSSSGLRLYYQTPEDDD